MTFFDLYVRNAKRIFWGSFYLSDGSPGLIGLIVAIALLPITTTLGALAKTTYDYCSGDLATEDTIDSTVNSIQNMSRGTMSQLITKLNEHDPVSKPSKRLKKQLSLDEVAYEKRLEEKRLKYVAREQNMSVDKAKNAFKARYINNYKLNSYHSEKLANVQPVKVGFTKSKTELVKYLKDENNNGKKLFQLIIGFFSNNSQNAKSNNKVSGYRTMSL